MIIRNKNIEEEEEEYNIINKNQNNYKNKKVE